MQDFSNAFRRSWGIVFILVVLGGVAGFLIAPPVGARQSVVDLRLESRVPLATSIGLPAELMTELKPSAVKADFEFDQDALLPDLPDDVSLALFADDPASILTITVVAGSIDESDRWALAAGDVIVESIRADQSQRIEAVRQYNTDVAAQLGREARELTADDGRARLLEVQSVHLNTLRALEELELSQIDTVRDPVLGPEPGQPSASIPISVAAGAVLGFIIALAVIYGRLMGDRRIRRSVDLEECIGMRTLATLAVNDSDATANALMPLGAALLKRSGSDGRVLIVGIDDANHAADVAAGLTQAISVLDPSATCTVDPAPRPSTSGHDFISGALRSSTTILVASYGVTTGPEAQTTARILDTAGAHLMGAVLVSVPKREFFWASSSGSATRSFDVTSQAG